MLGRTILLLTGLLLPLFGPMPLGGQERVPGKPGGASGPESPASDIQDPGSSAFGSADVGVLALRNIGPALVSGRISDVAVDPRNRSVWYVGVSSGGVWKTTNRGTTWEPIFD
ncbi:MAG: hypothetical protein ACWGSQ_19080, partial [Longimicrobiales bacterium]